MIAVNWHIVNDGMVISSIQKNASCSLTELFPEMTNHEAALDRPLRLSFIRHPLKRLQSAYKDLYSEELWTDFVDFALRTENVHWFPQTKLLTHCGNFVPNLVERFEDINLVWQEYCSTPLPHVNKSKETSFFPPYRLKALEDYYKEDLDLWESLA